MPDNLGLCILVIFLFVHLLRNCCVGRKYSSFWTSHGICIAAIIITPHSLAGATSDAVCIRAGKQFEKRGRS